jgi:CRP/FNR family transcriptional regulator
VAKRLSLPRGAVIFREGDEGDDVFQVLSGKVRISRKIRGVEHDFAVLGQGQYFGEMALFGYARSATATAAAATTLIKFSRTAFFARTQKDPAFALSLIEDLCSRLRNASDTIQRQLHMDDLHEDAFDALRSMHAPLHDSRHHRKRRKR